MKAKLIKENLEGIPWSGVDVTKAKPIGKIITKEWELQGGFKFTPEEYEVIEIIKPEGRDQIYVVNKWYKDYKRIPQLVPAVFVEKFIPYNEEPEENLAIKAAESLRRSKLSKGYDVE